VPSYSVSDHCDGERFFNAYESADRNLADVVRWMRTRQRTPWPADVPLTAQPPPPAHIGPGQVAITFVGHSTFLVRTPSTVFITDPVFTSHAGPFGRLGPRRVRPPAIGAADLPPVDLVLVSHNHYDHLQPASLRLFADRASFVAPLGVRRLLPPNGGSYLDEGGSDLRYELDWWQRVMVGRAEVTCVPAQHFSARTPWDRDRTLWCGFVVSVDDITVYFAGDTGYSPHFAEIAARFPDIDVALIPIGAYEPRWFMKPAHMNPEEAVRAHRDLEPGVSIAMHFGTFQLTDEGIDDPTRGLEAARVAAGVPPEAFRVLEFGESLLITGHSGERDLRRTSGNP
jgi:L-ascorbate metabolism protein UlaG (beta-lactamase superfamily)